MAKINVLDSSVYNKIAAGEVVERPASIVKELVENSVDAGATKIEIFVENGGLTAITVTDNGCGIEKPFVETAFLNHSTSKVANEEDLTKIATLGFRGEALASISAVSNVEMTTKTANDEFATKICLTGGKVTSKEEIGAPSGTTIKISDLFFNTPARKKFLKKPSGEASEITNTVQKLILANPKIAIRYVSNGNLIFNSQGLGLESAIFAAYDKNTLTNCQKIDWFYKDIEVSGFVGNKNFTKPNRTYQTAIVNGRYVSNSTISAAVQRAFDRYLTTRAYPFFVLNINLPVEKIDVNVHPNKMEVKFEDAQSVFYAVYVPIKELLGSAENVAIPQISVQNEPQKTSVQTDLGAMAKDNKSLFDELIAPAEKSHEFDGVAAPKVTLRDDAAKIRANDPLPAQKFSFSESITVGTAFNTYIIIQKDDDLLFIDQHAAHEMILYDKFTSNYYKSAGTKQPLLVPYVFSVKADEAEYLSANLDKIRDCGFEIEEFGNNSFKITDVPLIFANLDLEKFINGFLTDLDAEMTDLKVISDKLAKSACKAAVKAGDKLSQEDINHLKKLLNTSSVLRCPHGRPVVVKISKYEIEKWFKRVT